MSPRLPGQVRGAAAVGEWREGRPVSEVCAAYGIDEATLAAWAAREDEWARLAAKGAVF